MPARKIWHLLYPCLTDKEWLSGQLLQGKSRRQLAREIGCDYKTLQAALRSHDIGYPYAVVGNDALLKFEKKIK